MLQDPLGVQHSRPQQEAQQSQQDVHHVHQVQPTTEGPSTGAPGSGLRGTEERPSVSTQQYIVLILQYQDKGHFMSW